MEALDLFRGAGGWSVACQNLGIIDYGVEIMPEANATAEAAGFKTVAKDVWQVDYKAYRGVDGLIASPPCQTFSKAGKGGGRKALDDVLTALKEGAWIGRGGLRNLHHQVGDERTALVLFPLYAASVIEPRWIVLEQVPQVLPVWEAYAKILREEYDYRIWTGILSAEQYGVPQVRKRAVLIAREDFAHMPKPTHSRYYPRDPERFDPHTIDWISMAEALGWGSEEYVGFARLADPHRPYITIGGVGYRARDLRLAAHPSATVTSKARDWRRWRELVIEEVTPRVNNQSGTEFDYAWPCDRPAPTVAGREIITMPGANANRFNGSTKSRNDGIKVTAAEAGVLQGFPADYPWQGVKTNQFTQIGNAVPPPLAEAVLRVTLDR